MDSPPFLWADQQKMVYFCFEPCTVEYTVSNNLFAFGEHFVPLYKLCLLYTSDAADES